MATTETAYVRNEEYNLDLRNIWFTEPLVNYIDHNCNSNIVSYLLLYEFKKLKN